jgi:MMP 1-O-methyltransferase
MPNPSETEFMNAVAGLPPKPEYPDTLVGHAIQNMNTIPGFFSDKEAYEIYKIALFGLEVAPAIVEIGSFHGKSTSVLASACRASGKGRVFAIDPHQGTLFKGTTSTAPSLGFFLANMKRLELMDFVFPVVRTSADAKIPEPVGHLFIDGLHDFESVSADIKNATPWVASGGFVSFHDYWPHDMGVIQAVDDMMKRGGYEYVSQVDRLRTVKKL